MSHTLQFAQANLERASSDKQAFEQELGKSLSYLFNDEAKALKRWCMNRFDYRFHTIISRCYLERMKEQSYISSPVLL